MKLTKEQRAEAARMRRLLCSLSELVEAGLIGRRTLDNSLAKARSKLDPGLKIVHNHLRDWRVISISSPVFTLEVRQGNAWKPEARSEIKKFLLPEYYRLKSRGSRVRIRPGMGNK